jgi:ABC-2 type transport system ATP-binding protein
MIRISGLSHKLGTSEVLKNVDLTVPDGSIMGLVGINGAGKSTLLRLLSGVYVADEGSIEIDGA